VGKVTQLGEFMTDFWTRRSFLAAGVGGAAGLILKPGLAASQDLISLTLKDASELLRRKSASPVDLTEACLKRIDKYNSVLNAFITVSSEQAMAAAREAAAEQKRGRWRGPLHGIPIALKDNIDTKGIRTTAASELFKDRVPSEDAEVVRRLKDAGAVILGKVNLHEFAYGGTSDVTYFGAVHNPWALDHISGGSSGGSAAAVAAELCFGALGTDTAGSVRIPASYCGVVGFKPTYGRVSLRGVIPLSWTLDHCGPICKTVEDAALMLQAIAGYDQLDPATVDVPVPDYARGLKVKTSKLRLGVPRSPFFENLDGEVAKAVEAAIGVLRKMGNDVTETSLPPTFPLLLPITGPEAYAYHAKLLAESPDRYQQFTRERIIQFAADIKAPAYADALRQTNLLRREIKKVFSTVDLLITPTMPKPAETLANSKSFDPIGLQNTSPFDIFGLPTISVPCGFTNFGLPIGLQISGAPFAESTVLSLANAYERETEWHKKHPKLTSG
jgi:aspartyl-tRNA(Asn)/glutamyl-tRNA(Gln) amidotransferase subunit A